MVVLTIALLLLAGWLGFLSYVMTWQGREIKILMLAVKNMAGAERHVGGTGRSQRRTDFRVRVQLNGFLRVREHARPCRIVDLSRSGAQVLPDGGSFPVGEVGVLTIEFGEFDSGTTHARVVRAIKPTGTYGLQFVDPPQDFMEKTSAIIRRLFREQVNATSTGH